MGTLGQVSQVGSGRGVGGRTYRIGLVFALILGLVMGCASTAPHPDPKDWHGVQPFFVRTELAPLASEPQILRAWIREHASEGVEILVELDRVLTPTKEEMELECFRMDKREELFSMHIAAYKQYVATRASKHSWDQMAASESEPLCFPAGRAAVLHDPSVSRIHRDPFWPSLRLPQSMPRVRMPQKMPKK